MVRPLPSFLKIFLSTSLSMTVACTWQPSSCGRQANACSQRSSCSESMESATSTSSVCSRGFFPCSMFTFVRWIGSIIFCGISRIPWSIPARCLSALSSSAALGPSNALVCAVIIVPSASSIAEECTPSFSLRSWAATVVRRSAVVILSCFISRSILFTSLSPDLPWAKSHSAV